MLSVLSIVLIILVILFIGLAIYLIVKDDFAFGVIVLVLIIGFFAWGSITNDIDRDNVKKIANHYIENMKQEGYLTEDIKVQIKKDLYDEHINAYIEGTEQYENDKGKKIYLNIYKYGFFSFNIYVTGDKN